MSINTILLQLLYEGDRYDTVLLALAIKLSAATVVIVVVILPVCIFCASSFVSDRFKVAALQWKSIKIVLMD